MDMDHTENQEEFLRELSRMLYDEDRDPSEVLPYILDALKGEVEVGDISDLVYDRYIVDKIKEGVKAKALELEERNKTKLRAAEARLESTFERRVQSACELQGIYRVVKEKFLSDKAFLAYALDEIKKDLRKSKKAGKYPFLYRMTLEHCDHGLLIASLIDQYGDSLLAEFREELRTELKEVHQEDLLNELTSEMRQDESLIEKLQAEIKADLVRAMFG
jgi:hypothetical protein